MVGARGWAWETHPPVIGGPYLIRCPGLPDAWLCYFRSFDGAFGPFREQSEGLARHLSGGTAGHGHVGGAVGNIRAKSAFFDHDSLPDDGLAESAIGGLA